jgi:hypothetical protein
MEWPEGITYKPIERWPRKLTVDREYSPFRAGLTSTVKALGVELRALDAVDVILQVALPASDFRIDGRPRARAVVEHPGVILSFEADAGPLSFPADRYRDMWDNLRAITLTMNALRDVTRYGVSQTGEQYRGWAALEAGPSARPPRPNEFENVDQATEYLIDSVAFDADEVIPAGAKLVQLARRVSHPDMGGNAEWFDRVNQAADFLKAAGAL